ncbi:MAG: hypothetical protein QNJ37_21750 [Crocosphaera sp.]|nr:hypothetical protein [Crocosphaera sp.]
MAELTHIAEKRRVTVTIDELLDKINQGDGFTIVGFDFPIFQQMLTLPKDWDIHDRIIAATASYYLNLITQLLSCNEGDEPQILQENQELVGKGLIEVMIAVAQQFEEGGD